MFRFNLWPRPFIHPSTGAPGTEGATPFFPNPLALSPAMAFANAMDTAKSSLQDKDKDCAGVTPYSTALPIFRSGDAACLPPAALYSPLHQQFLRAHMMELASAQSRDETAYARMVHASAFTSAPAAKRARVEETNNERDSPARSAGGGGASGNGGDSDESPADMTRSSGGGGAHAGDDSAISSPASHRSGESSARELDDSEERRSTG